MLPLAKRVIATEDYYGTTVADPDPWMENINDPDLLPWLKAQNEESGLLEPGACL